MLHVLMKLLFRAFKIMFKLRQRFYQEQLELIDGSQRKRLQHGKPPNRKQQPHNK